MSDLVDGLGPNGTLVVIGVDFAPMEITPLPLIGAADRFEAGPRVHLPDTEDALPGLPKLSGVRPMVEICPLSVPGEAYARMMVALRASGSC